MVELFLAYSVCGIATSLSVLYVCRKKADPLFVALVVPVIWPLVVFRIVCRTALLRRLSNELWNLEGQLSETERGALDLSKLTEKEQKIS